MLTYFCCRCTDLLYYVSIRNSRGWRAGLQEERLVNHYPKPWRAGQQEAPDGGLEGAAPFGGAAAVCTGGHPPPAAHLRPPQGLPPPPCPLKSEVQAVMHSTKLQRCRDPRPAASAGDSRSIGPLPSP